MRHSREKAASTRSRIIEAAADAFRRDGIQATGIIGLMDEAGLSHGGFYKHFESKDQLVAEACEHMFRSVVERLSAMVAAVPPRRRLARFIELYLSPEHRDNPSQGCAFAALGSELSHASAMARIAADRGVTGMTEVIAGFIPDLQGAAATARAQVIAATMVGAITLARAVADLELSDALLANTRKSLSAQGG